MLTENDDIERPDNDDSDTVARPDSDNAAVSPAFGPYRDDVKNLPKTRQEARRLGAKRYFTGVPCKHGHVAPRLLSNGCTACNNMYNRTPQQQARRKVARLRPHRQVTERAALKEYRSRPEVRVKLTRYSRERMRRVKGMPQPTRPCPTTCEICGTTPNIALHLDHCHASGKFRGWLCANCNLGLGNFRDRPDLFLAAITYLKVNGG